MTQELMALTITAASIGFLHTLLGPDHYLPFIVMARAGRWSLIKTAWVTALCGIGHVGGSVLLGMIGIALGLAVTKLELTESWRGSLAAWALIAFGVMYFVWGLRRARRHQPHEHIHHDTTNLTPWILFVIFVLGPCEPLIPILMYPAAKNSLLGVMWVTGIFGGVTILTMLGVVLISSLGVNLLPLGRLERYTHALAGAAIFACGMAIQFLGL